MAEMIHLQCLLGIQCRDFAMIAADQTTTQSVIILKNDENKIHPVSDRILMGMIGDPAAAGQFAQFVAKNIQLYRMKNKYGLTAPAAVHFTRKNLADMLKSGLLACKNVQLYRMKNKQGLTSAAAVHFTRKNLADMLKSGNASMVNMLVAGYDEELGGQLYALDFLASCVKVPYAVHGFGGVLSIGILDRYHSYSLTPVEAHEVLKMCVYEIHQRLFTTLANFQVKMVCRDGIRDMPTINNQSFTKA